MNYYFYDNYGQIKQQISVSEGTFYKPTVPEGLTMGVGDATGCRFDIHKKTLVKLPPKPTGSTAFSHTFNYVTLEWVDNRTYADFRSTIYPSIGEQLDMLYHAMKNGEIPVATEWFNTIQQVKDKYPKGNK